MLRSSGGSGWKIVEEESYDLAVAQSKDPKAIDEAIAPIELGLHRNPKEFPAVPGFENLHIAKTKLRFLDGAIIPSYRLWFRADEETRTVHKLWVELTPPDSQGFPDGEDNIDIDF